MAAEHHQPDAHISIGQPPTATLAAISSPDPPLNDHPATATTAAANPPKRQRRPSVRLGEIGGDPPYDTQQRRPPSKTWRFHKDPSLAAKTSKTRPLTNLVNGGGGGGGGDFNFVDSAELSENYANFNHGKPKNKKTPKRVRTNWNRFDPGAANNGGGVIEDNDDFRELEGEGSESPLLKEQQSPNNSEENMGLQFWDQHRRGSRARVSDSNGPHLNEANSTDKYNNNVGSTGVREWLIGLGLGRYVAVFEIHEVDDEVLPMLTLEDLKDMGINAVGSRRKMYSAILKLRKGFS